MLEKPVPWKRSRKYCQILEGTIEHEAIVDVEHFKRPTRLPIDDADCLFGKKLPLNDSWEALWRNDSRRIERSELISGVP